MPTEEEKKAVAESLLDAWTKIVETSFEHFSSGAMYDVFDGLWLYAYCINPDLSHSRAVKTCLGEGLTIEQIRELLPDAATEFRDNAPNAVANEINALGILCLTEIVLKPTKGDKYKLVLEVTAPDTLNALRTTERVRAELTLNRGVVERRLINKGRLSQWSKDDLEPIIRRTLELLPKPRRTYDNVLSILKGIYGDDAPETGEALRKALERIGIDWKALKADIP